MTGYFKKITNPAIQRKGFQLSKIIEDLGDGTVYGEVDEKILPTHQRVLLSEQIKLNNLFPAIG